MTLRYASRCFINDPGEPEKSVGASGPRPYAYLFANLTPFSRSGNVEGPGF